MNNDTLIVLAVPLAIIIFSLMGSIWDSFKNKYLCCMFNQSGVKSLTLYNAATTTFTRLSKTSITNLVGDSITIDNEMNPTLEQTNKVINRRNHFEYTFNASLFRLEAETSQYRNKFGWLVLITFLDGETRFLNSPVFLQNTELDTNKAHIRPLEFKTERPTGKTLNFE